MKYSDKFLLNELRRFVKENNRNPTSRDFDNNKNYPCATPYKYHFGSWNDALIAADLKVNHICKKLTGEERCYKCSSKVTSAGWFHKNGKIICKNCYANDRNFLYGMLDPDSKVGMGVITEHVVYEVLNKAGDTLSDCKKCNINDEFHANYDLISKKYGTINVKSVKLQKIKNENSYYWKFSKHKNSNIPDNYVCIGFNKDKTKILKVWIINGNSNLVNKGGIKITNSEIGLKRALQYEVDVTPYNEVYQNLNIYNLSEFRNLNIMEGYNETMVSTN